MDQDRDTLVLFYYIVKTTVPEHKIRPFSIILQKMSRFRSKKVRLSQPFAVKPYFSIIVLFLFLFLYLFVLRFTITSKTTVPRERRTAAAA